MKSKIRRFLIVGLLPVLLVGIFSTAISLTLAAYLNINKNSVSLDYKAETIGSTYFAGGSGTTADPYQISTASQLKNLQALNSIGLFGPGNFFILKNDITWTADDGALLPIGTDDVPFSGNFDGKGKTITDLVVNGGNTTDVGMFGYVSITGTVKNFILYHPTINLSANTGGGSLSSTNFLGSYFETAAKALATPRYSDDSETSGTLVWTNGTASATLSGLDSTITSSTLDKTLSIDWTSSDETLLSLVDGVWTTHANSASENPSKDIYPVHLTGQIFYELNGRISAYTVERYQINIMGSGIISTAKTVTSSSGGNTTKEYNGMFKTMWPDGDYHGTYVGFFVGHLDGYALYLGLNGGNSFSTSTNGIINVSGRTVSSTTSLVGRSRSDNIKDSTASKRYNKYLDFTKDVDFSDITPSAPTDTYTTEEQFSNQQTRALALTKKYLDSDDTTTSTYLRLYPSLSRTTNDSYSYIDDSGRTQTVSGTSIVIDKALSAGVESKRVAVGNSWLGGTNYQLVRNFYVNNGLWFWSTSKADDRYAAIMGEDKFEIQFNITYYATTTSQDKNQNAFQILYDYYNPEIKVNYLVAWTYTESHMQMVHFYDLANPSFWNGTSFEPAAAEYTPVPIEADGYLHQTEVSIIIDKGTSSGLGALFSTIFSSDTWYPCFAIGAGSNGSLTQTASDTNITYNTTKKMQQFSNNLTGTQYTNDYFSLNGDLSLHLIDVDVVFTSRVGNVSSLMNEVDFVGGSNECVFDDASGSYSSWPKESGIKVNFDVTQGLSGTPATYSFYRAAESGGLSATVYGKASNSTYPLNNTSGYKSATLS